MPREAHDTLDALGAHLPNTYPALLLTVLAAATRRTTAFGSSAEAPIFSSFNLAASRAATSRNTFAMISSLRPTPGSPKEVSFVSQSAWTTRSASTHGLIIVSFSAPGKVMAGSTPCPITGDYTGPVPGTTGLCAKVASDCNNPDIMFYSVMSCENRSHVFEGKR